MTFSIFGRKHRGMTTILLLCFLFYLCINPTGINAAVQSSEKLLREGIKLYHAAKFNEAIAKIQLAQGTGLNKKEDIIKANQYLAFSYAAIDNVQDAKKHFIIILRLDPGFDLQVSESPKLRNLLEEARQLYFRQYPEKSPKPPKSKTWLWLTLGAVGGSAALALSFIGGGGDNGNGPTIPPKLLPDPPPVPD